MPLSVCDVFMEEKESHNKKLENSRAPFWMAGQNPWATGVFKKPTYFLGGPKPHPHWNKLAFWGPCRWARFRDSHRSEHRSSVGTPQWVWVHVTNTLDMKNESNGNYTTPAKHGVLIRVRTFPMVFFSDRKSRKSEVTRTLFQRMIGKLVVWSPVVWDSNRGTIRNNPFI